MLVILLVTLLDGSAVNLKVPAATVLQFQTKHGQLSIPLGEVRECAVGVHVDTPEEYAGHAKALGDEKYGSRDEAMKFLKNHSRGAYRYLAPLKTSKDPEVARRVELLLKEYREFPIVEDKVSWAGSAVAGDITTPSLVGESACLGKLSIPFSQIKSILARMPAAKITIAGSDGWKEVGYVIDGQLAIKASGEVDLWPQGGGQHVTGPDGYNQVSGTYPAGALIGRVGTKTFLVGRDFHTNNMDRGKLELRINGSPWQNCTPSGEYTVEVE